MVLHGWESLSKDRRVRFGAPVASGLRMLAIEAFAALPRRGIEVGGILFGEVHESEARIDAFEEAPCEHRYGPSYSLSPADKIKLGALLAERAGSGQVIGFFRSFTGREPTIEEGDEVLVREHFPKGDFVYLLLQPLSVENCLASFRFFHDGQMLPANEEEAPFAFDLRQMPVAEPVAEAKPEPPVLPPPFRAVAEEPARRRTRSWIPAALVSLFLVLGAMGGLYYETSATPRESRWTDLHLDARTEAGRLEVTWDATVPTVANAVRGRLNVSDGGVPRDVALNAAQVRAGKMSLPTSQPNVALRLVVYGDDGGAMGDAIRVALLPANIPMPEDRQTSAVPAAPPPQAQAKAAPAAQPPQPAHVAGIAIPPSTVREVQPRIPEGIRSRIGSPVVIPVEVQVSDQGRVVHAKAEASSTDGVQRYLAAQAQKAAREWRFKPARTKSGATIAASKTIQFVFNP
jgi:TonB family protein